MQTMDEIKVLDVTLRDGGHRRNFHFDKQELAGILTPLDNSGLEYIEIGYRNGAYQDLEDIGCAGLCKREYLELCQSLVKKAKITVMVCPKKVTKSDLTELKECGVELVRICIAPGELETSYPLFALVNELGMESSANFINLSTYQEQTLDKAIDAIAIYNPTVIYFADSNGSMLPEKIQDIYSRCTKRLDIPFGFHAHDNLGLAQANALAALKGGAQFIDVSLAGMGKGIGNLKTEFFTAYLHAINIKKYRLPDILMAANYVRSALGVGKEGIDMDEFNKAISML
jgi:4-hydroxy 2-oxovalerate aldolase